ncbi:hypothetical protein SAMN02982990_02991 [Photorhabdus luminescens]|uniref:Uncharacterized protein n=1 Tax=Photorhabdus luminescens TaxID=29488 RepID=A0A1G5R3B2_PHOLU|nr:hypothetical protein SAMN02982990_02991 [Photorhabdus luminescens]
MSLFFNFLNESNGIFKQRELSYHLNSFNTIPYGFQDASRRQESESPGA